MEKKSLKKNFIYNIILKVMNVIFPFITFPYIARILSPEGLGRVDFTLSFVQYFILLAQVGIPTYGVRECSKYRDNHELLSKKVQEILLINITMMLCSYGLLAVIIYTQNTLLEYRHLILIASINIFGTSIGMEWFFQAIEEYKYITIRSLIIKLVSILMIFLMVKDQSDFIIYALITVLSHFFSYFVNFLYSRKYINIYKKLDGYDFKTHIKPIAVLFSLSIAVSIYINLDKVMLGFMVGDRYVGLYAAANKLIRVILAVVTALGAVLLPRITYNIEKGEKLEVKRIISKSIDFVLMISIPSVVGIIALAKPIIQIFAGVEYLEAVKTIQILSILIMVIGLSNLVGIQILVSYGLEKVTLIATIIGALINVGLNSITIPKYYHNGAAISSVFAEVAVASVVIYGGYKYLKGNIKFRSIFQYIIGSGFIFLFSRLLNYYISNIIILLICTVIISIGSYVVILFLAKNELIIEVYSLTINRFYAKRQ